MPIVGSYTVILSLNKGDIIMTKTLSLRSLDIPALHKFGIGFDPMFDEIMRITSNNANSSYPPHNVIKTGAETVTIEIAVAGFNETEINISLDNRTLIIAGAMAGQHPDADYEYLHRGLSNRDFTQTFSLAEHVEVIAATNVNGILSVYLERKIPDSAKPKTIVIQYKK